MTPSVWRSGCPVDLDDLRRVTVQHWTYTGKIKTGQIDVHQDVADALIEVFRDLYDAKFPIKKMVPIEAYGGSDDRSIDDDNTSAFNCRPITGGKKFSQHSYGTAIDLNPYRNPYVNNGKARARPGIATYVTRDPAVAKVGVIYPNGPVVPAFEKRGFKWGGYWDNPKDYQHFSTTGG
jgi:D-alanyl-D-alanine carboxypeptidase